MRHRNAALFVLLFSITPLTGQEEPLPAVTPRSIEPEVMLVALATEPIRDYHQPTLAEAARNNDFVSFDALYRAAKERGENVARFTTLHELWIYNVTDPIGAFYGADMYARLSRAYPGFAAYIADHAIVDNNGNTFYPTAETREFVLARALEGTSAPRVLIAESDGLTTPKPAPVREARARRSATTRRAAPAPVPAPVVAQPAPAVVAETPAPASAPVVETKEPVAVAEQPVQQQPAAVQQQPVTVPAPAVATTSQQQPIVDASATSRGILLIVIGLLGVGLLAVMFRTPKESAPPSITAPVVKPAEPVNETMAEEKPPAPVEPIRPRAGGRASGSRG